MLIPVAVGVMDAGSGFAAEASVFWAVSVWVLPAALWVVSVLTEELTVA